jgi:alpha-1,6-mannosyltransferase
MTDTGAALSGERLLADDQHQSLLRSRRATPAGRVQDRHRAWAWGGLGLAGSLLVALTGPRVVDGGGASWWYELRIGTGRGLSLTLLWLGMAALCVAWLGLGRRLQDGAGVRPAQLLVIGAAWLTPLALGPALFSRDVYSYLAQGEILHLGLDPYHVAPVVLGRHGQGQILAAVSPFWRGTTAPYGPLLLALLSLIVSLSGSNLIVGVLLIRLLELGGIALLVVFVPRLARAVGGDPVRALWLAVLSPLAMLELIAAGHNDALMIGLLVAGVTLALERRPLLGIAICALACTIKLPAIIGAVFIAVVWVRAQPTRSDGLTAALKALLVLAAILAIISVATGLGIGWVSTTLFSTPAKVRLAITPATGIGYTVSSLLHDLGATVNARGVESAVGVFAAALTGALGAVLLWRVRIESLAWLLGLVLIAAAAGGPVAWPWYFTWGLVLLAAAPGPQRSLALALAVAVAVFVVKPNGILTLALASAPAVVCVYAAIGLALWYRWRLRTPAWRGIR